MDSPLEIVFHNLPTSASLESEIRDGVDKLERLYGRLVGCRVSVEALHHQHRTGNIYEVHIEMQVPGGKLVVSHAPHHARERFAHPDIRVPLREAFRAAEEQLKSFKTQQYGTVKAHPPAFQGQVSQLFPDQDYGFILTNEGGQLYFHRNSLLSGSFDALRRGALVHFIEAMGDTGPTASKVWLAEATRETA